MRHIKNLVTALLIVAIAFIFLSLVGCADSDHLVYMPIANNPRSSFLYAPTVTPTPELSAPIVTPESTK